MGYPAKKGKKSFFFFFFWQDKIECVRVYGEHRAQTLQPALPKERAIARPMPLEAPVTTTTGASTFSLAAVPASAAVATWALTPPTPTVCVSRHVHTNYHFFFSARNEKDKETKTKNEKKGSVKKSTREGKWSVGSAAETQKGTELIGFGPVDRSPLPELSGFPGSSGSGGVEKEGVWTGEWCHEKLATRDNWRSHWYVCMNEWIGERVGFALGECGTKMV